MKKKKRNGFKTIEPFLYLLPAMIILVMFMIYPMIRSFTYSVLDWNGMNTPKMVGLHNFSKLIFHDQDFWNSIRLTFLWVIMSTVILTVTGLILAFLLDNFAKSKLVAGVTRTLLFMPMMMSLVAVGLLWSLIYNPTLGIITNLIAQLHLFGNAAPFDFLGSQKTAIYAAFVPAIWQWSGFGMVVFSAAILNIPGELKEAATVDGANKFKIMLNIELPLIMPTIIVVSTVNLIGGFKAFDLVYVMTAGGPGSSTMVTAIYMFIQAFKNMNLGYASAIAILLFILTVVFAMLTTRLTSLLNKKAGY